MLHSTSERSQNRLQSTILHVLRYPMMWLALVVLLATLTLILGTRLAVQANTPAPADLFMQSVVKRDGTLAGTSSVRHSRHRCLSRRSPARLRSSALPSPGRA